MKDVIHRDREEIHRQSMALSALLVFVFCMILGYLAYAFYKMYEEHGRVIYDMDSAAISQPSRQIHN